MVAASFRQGITMESSIALMASHETKRGTSRYPSGIYTITVDLYRLAAAGTRQVLLKDGRAGAHADPLVGRRAGAHVAQQHRRRVGLVRDQRHDLAVDAIGVDARAGRYRDNTVVVGRHSRDVLRRATGGGVFTAPVVGHAGDCRGCGL